MTVTYLFTHLSDESCPHISVISIIFPLSKLQHSLPFTYKASRIFVLRKEKSASAGLHRFLTIKSKVFPRSWIPHFEQEQLLICYLSSLCCKYFLSITEESITTCIHTSQLPHLSLHRFFSFFNIPGFNFESIGFCVL